MFSTVKVQEEMNIPNVVETDLTGKTLKEENVYRKQKIQCMIRYYNELAEAGGMEPIKLEEVTSEIIKEHEKRDKVTVEMREQYEKKVHKRKRKEAYAELLQKIMLMGVE